MSMLIRNMEDGPVSLHPAPSTVSALRAGRLSCKQLSQWSSMLERCKAAVDWLGALPGCLSFVEHKQAEVQRSECEQLQAQIILTSLFSH